MRYPTLLLPILLLTACGDTPTPASAPAQPSQPIVHVDKNLPDSILGDLFATVGEDYGAFRKEAGSLNTEDLLGRLAEGMQQAPPGNGPAEDQADGSPLGELLDLGKLLGGDHSALDRLSREAVEGRDGLVAQRAGISPGELKELQALPQINHITSGAQATEVLAKAEDPKLAQLYERPGASAGFRIAIDQYRSRRVARAEAFAGRAAAAKADFRSRNPDLYFADLSLESTYAGRGNDVIYLPLGKRSFADRVVEHLPGSPPGRNAERSLGEPYETNDPYKNVGHVGYGGRLTLFFEDNAITDVNGPDLYVFEVGEIEETLLELSRDGQEWTSIGRIEGGTAYVDIAGKVPRGETYTWLRLTDLNNQSSIPGADIDAVAAIGSATRLSLDSEVLFATGSDALRPGAEASFTGILTTLRRLGGGSVIVEGHTDDVGSAATNQSLSERRAQTVRNYLSQELPSDKYRWTVRGYGESRPVVPNENEENRSLNRRVELLVLPG